MYPEITRDEVFMIATPRLWLRWPTSADAAALATLSGDRRVATMIASWPVGASESFARDRIAKLRSDNASGNGLSLVIAKRSDWKTPIGLIGITSTYDDRGKHGLAGYHLAADQWDRGYASEALKGLIDMTRLLTRMPRVKASVLPDNTASAEVLRKTGFVFAGSGKLATAHRGTVEVDQYERDLRAIGYDVDGALISPRSMRPEYTFETDFRVS